MKRSTPWTPWARIDRAEEYAEREGMRLEWRMVAGGRGWGIVLVRFERGSRLGEAR